MVRPVQAQAIMIACWHALCKARDVNRGSGRWWYLLLLVPFVAILWVPFYASGEPVVLGFPFFYWYQFLWILISAVLTAIVYFATREPESAYGDDAASAVEDLER